MQTKQVLVAEVVLSLVFDEDHPLFSELNQDWSRRDETELYELVSDDIIQTTATELADAITEITILD